MNRNHESTLPDTHIEVCHINAKDAKLGWILNLVALAVAVLVMGIAVGCIALGRAVGYQAPVTDANGMAAGLIFAASMFLYIVLHELVHGIAYKLLTHEKLTFGLSWSCAFCGVPRIYTYRRTALIALLAPCVTFTMVLLPLTVGLFFVHPAYFLFSALLLGLHLGGCSGDLYMTALLLFRYRATTTLIRDTGPEQFIYIKK